MGLPETNGWQVQVGMLAWSESPRSSHRHRNADGVAGERLYKGLRSSLAEVVVDNTADPDEPIAGPDRNDYEQPLDLLEICQFKVVPEASNCQRSEQDVQNLERLVVGMSGDARSLKGDGNERACGLGGVSRHIYSYGEWSETHDESEQHKLLRDRSVQCSSPSRR